MFQYNDSGERQCVQCTGDKFEQRTMICNKVGASSIDCFQYQPWPQCPTGEYCNITSLQCESIDSAYLKSTDVAECPGSLVWSKEYNKCVQCLHNRRQFQNPQQKLMPHMNMDCHEGILYPTYAGPLHAKTRASPKAVFLIMILVIFLIVLLCESVTEIYKCWNMHYGKEVL